MNDSLITADSLQQPRGLDRRGFLCPAGTMAAGGLAAAALLERPGDTVPSKVAVMSLSRKMNLQQFARRVWHLVAIWGWLVCASLAQAQSGQPPASSVVQPMPWADLFFIERCYKIEAVSFKALDETGVDWWGADEVKVETRDAKGWTVSNEIDNIDSGDTHHFDPAKSCIVSVRPGVVVLGKSSICDEAGEPAPLWFEVEMWEKDWSPFGFCVVLGPDAGKHAGDSCGHDGGDDFIGRERLDFPAADLEAALPNVGDTVVESVLLFPRCDPGFVCDVTWDGRYRFTYRVTRLRDQRVVLKDLLDKAVNEIRARSELEAIAAGLRALRAQQPRDVTVEKE
jgi:hypothetical protein